VITYMTWSRYGKTAHDLTVPALSQQMSEAMDLFDQLTGIKDEVPHPALEMWRGYEFALGIYGMMLNIEWTFERGFANHDCFKFFSRALKEMQNDDPDFFYEPPPWLRDRAVFLSHRSNLTRRKLTDTSWKTTPKNWPYIWPRIDETREEGYSLWLSKSDKMMVKEGKRSRPDKEVLDRIVNWP